MDDTSTDDYERILGVVEAITVVTRQCPSGAVRGCAEQALAGIQAGGSDAMREQAYIVLTAIQGWRGGRAKQVHASLDAFLSTPESTTGHGCPPA